jgi:hypothetical protein
MRPAGLSRALKARSAPLPLHVTLDSVNGAIRLLEYLQPSIGAGEPSGSEHPCTVYDAAAGFPAAAAAASVTIAVTSPLPISPSLGLLVTRRYRRAQERFTPEEF